MVNKDILQLIKLVEQLNNENMQMLSSKEYQFGKKVFELKRIIKKCDIVTLVKKIYNVKNKRKEEKNLQVYVQQDNGMEYEENIGRDKKIVVYTCITGDYDNVLDPLYIAENVEYVLYTNSSNIQSNRWKIRKIPAKIAKLGNNILINRYIKMHAHELFTGEYDYSIYIDGNIRTISDIYSFITKVKTKTGLALHRHYMRDCIYLEAEACKLYKKGKCDKLKIQIERYKKEGMPIKYGLLECNIIVSDLNSDNAKKILNDWWKEFIYSDSNRDQICLPYILWKLNYKIEDIGNLGNNVHRNSKIRIEKHN